MRLTKLNITFLVTLLFLSPSLMIHTLAFPFNHEKSLFTAHERQISPTSDRDGDPTIFRPGTHLYQTNKLVMRDGQPPSSASELLSSLYPKAPQCLDTIEQHCPTIFTAIQDAAANNTSAANLYGSIISVTCLDVCCNGTEPMKWIQWLTRFSQSAALKADINQRSLQDDWIDWLVVSRRAREAMVPWKWKLVADLSDPQGPATVQNAPYANLQCPKASSILWSFAVPNVCLVLLGIIFRRRDFIHWLTCGALGKPPVEETPDGIFKRMGSWLSPRPQEKALADASRRLSRYWLFGGCLTCALSLVANFANAVIVKATPGFAHTPLVQLVILWTSRPRAGWFVLLWTNHQSRKNIYVSAAWSAVCAELLLQICGSYYLGLTAHYGVESGFFWIGPFQDVPDGHWGLVMYAGAILWIASIGLMLPCALGIIIYGVVTAGEVRFGSEAHTKRWGMYFQWAFFVVPFIGQWMFWIGYVNIANDAYCPPHIWSNTGVWIAFGVVTSVTGGAF